MKLSNYQNPEGTAKDWKQLAPRTNEIRYKDLSWLDIVKKRTVLDIGCNNGFFTREALKRGARRAVGIDIGECIEGARDLAKEENVPAEFWKISAESREFKRLCPQFEVVVLLSVLTHMKDREGFLDWLDSICTYALVFESNHGEKNKEHIELIKKHFWFESITYWGAQDSPEKPHYLWVCRKHNHEIRYPFLQGTQIEFIDMDKIIGWDEESILRQETKYDVHSEDFTKLKDDIKRRGLRIPLILEDEKNGVYKGFQGGHRYLAAKQLGYITVPCKVMRGQVIKHLNK